MARQEHDREDLLREATALVQRGQWRVAGLPEPVVVGFRRDGCGSVYLGGDEAYHFNTQGELRRAFVCGVLYKAEHGRLVAMRRHRGAGAVELRSRGLSAEEAASFLQRMRDRLQRLADALAGGDAACTGAIPDEAGLVDRVRTWLPVVLRGKVGRTPRAGR
jgi:hypothetical protein